MRLLSCVVVAATLALFATNCVTKTCTEIGCMHHVSVKLTTASGEWTDGMYELAVRADAETGTCTFAMPAATNYGSLVSCGHGIQLNVTPQTQCQSGCDASSCWQSCTPIPGKFDGYLVITGTPAHVDVGLTRDGQPILSEELDPAYQDAYPNGPECGPACRQATVAYTIP